MTLCKAFVAPFTGAWIETSPRPSRSPRHALSRPSRARGLKQTVIAQQAYNNYVAPFTGAWIETQ